MEDGNCMKSNKHIAWLVPGFARDENDSTCLPYLQALLFALKKNYPDITISVFTFQYPFKKGWYKINEINIFSAAGKNKKGISKLITWRTILKEAKSLHAKNPIDIIQSFWLTECTLVGERLQKKMSVPHFAYIMGQDSLKRNKYLSPLNFSKLKTIALSDFTANKFYETTSRKADAVIPIGLSIDEIPSFVNYERTIDIIGVGSLIPLKQYDLFIEIIAEVKKDFPFIRCELCGDGIEKEKLPRLISNYNLQDNILLCGSISRNDVLTKMNQSKMFLHTSSFESMGYVFFEALHFGCHLVSFSTGMIPETQQTHVCNTKDEMIAVIKNILQVKSENKQQEVICIDESVKRLVNFYNE